MKTCFHPHRLSSNVKQILFCYYKNLHYAKNRQVAGSIPDGVTGNFQWHNRSGRTLALVWTQPLTEMITKCISWG